MRWQSHFLLAGCLLWLLGSQHVGAAEGAGAIGQAVESSASALEAVLVQAKAHRAAGRFAEAQALLETTLGQDTHQAIRHKLTAALAELHGAWGEKLAAQYAYPAAITQYQQALKLDREARPAQAAQHLFALGQVYLDASQYEQALQTYEEALSIFRQVQDRQSEGRTLSKLGETHAALSQNTESKELFEHALAIHREIEDRQGEGETLVELGGVYLSLSQYKTALQLQEQALAIQREIRDRKGQGETLSRMGTTYRNLSQNDRSLSSLEQGLAIRREVGDHRGEGESLNGLGVTYFMQAQYEAALTALNQALVIRREVHDRLGEGITLSSLGSVYQTRSEYATAMEYLEQALAIFREIKFRTGEGVSLTEIGWLYNTLGQGEKALTYLEQSLIIAQETGERLGEGMVLSRFGGIYQGMGQPEKAIPYFEQALTIIRGVENPAREGVVLNNLGLAYLMLSQFETAQSYYEQALALAREGEYREAETFTLINLANLYRLRSQHDRASPLVQQALRIAREIGHRRLEAEALSILGIVSHGQSQHRQALTYSKQALALKQEFGLPTVRELNTIGISHFSLSQYDAALAHLEPALAAVSDSSERDLESDILNNLGTVYFALSQYDKAIAYNERALPKVRAGGNRQVEAAILNNLGSAYNAMHQYPKAIEYFEQVLHIEQEIGDQAGRGLTLLSLGRTYAALSQYSTAIEHLEQALDIAQQIPDPSAEGASLSALGNLYALLGQDTRAITYYKLDLAIDRRLENRLGEGRSLNNLGLAYTSLGQYDTAVEHLEWALAIAREVKDPTGEGASLNNLGHVHHLSGKPERALEYNQQALAIDRRIKNRGGEGVALGNRSMFSLALGDYEVALRSSEQALVIFRETEDRNNEGTILSNLMNIWAAQNKPQLAIFYGKQAVNIYQAIRGDGQRLEQDLQQSLLASKEDTYRTLADLLISEGRLPEAEQVLSLLKHEELFAFVRRSHAAVDPLVRLALTTQEETWATPYQEIAGRLTTLGQKRQALRQKSSLSPAEETRLLELNADLGVAQQAFHAFLAELTTALGDSQTAGQQILTAKTALPIQDTLRQLSPGTVVLYTLVSAEKYWLVLVTPEIRKAYEVPIKAEELNHKVLQFRQALQCQRCDPRPLAHALYTILLAPAAEDLRQMNAQTLLWSLDGVLRYLPMAALHDGERYLVERYRSVLFTFPDGPGRYETPRAEWRATGLGVSKAHAEFPALTSVPAELRAIIREGEEGTTLGVLPGTRALDGQFTERALQLALVREYPVVHLASHFHFQPGNETDSFLLLGDGSRLSIAKLKGYDFGGVELLTLSACQTAMGSDQGAGREVESFAMLAQAQGARTVLASLWAVADESTKELMAGFYRLREGEDLSKAEALQEAQLRLLHGHVKGTAGESERAAEVIQKAADSELPVFEKDPAAPYAHPYYWAPFILIGNWL